MGGVFSGVGGIKGYSDKMVGRVLGGGEGGCLGCELLGFVTNV